MGDGPSLFVIHGFTGDMTTWDHFVEKVKNEFFVISVDILGHGLSDSPVDPELYDMQHTVDSLSSVLDYCGVRKVNWLGYSMGGRIALSTALALPNRTAGLIVESGSTGLASYKDRESRITSDSKLADWIEKVDIEEFVDYWESLPLWASQIRLKRDQKRKLRSQRLRNNRLGLANSLRGMGTGVQPYVHERLNQIHSPTLVISGMEDEKYLGISRLMSNSIENCQTCFVKEAGHSVHLEQPDEFVAAIEGFLKSK